MSSLELKRRRSAGAAARIARTSARVSCGMSRTSSVSSAAPATPPCTPAGGSAWHACARTIRPRELVLSAPCNRRRKTTLPLWAGGSWGHVHEQPTHGRLGHQAPQPWGKKNTINQRLRQTVTYASCLAHYALRIRLVL
eukprot:1183875-Prorocentrum_minimum.AAC.2